MTHGLTLGVKGLKYNTTLNGSRFDSGSDRIKSRLKPHCTLTDHKRTLTVIGTSLCAKSFLILGLKGVKAGMYDSKSERLKLIIPFPDSFPI